MKLDILLLYYSITWPEEKTKVAIVCNSNGRDSLLSSTKQLFLSCVDVQTFLISDWKSRESSMTRGNQRDMAREKAAKKDKGKQKASNEQEANKGLTKEQRMARYV